MQRTIARDSKPPYPSREGGINLLETARNPSNSRKAKYKSVTMSKILLRNTLLETLQPAVRFNATQCSQQARNCVVPTRKRQQM